MAAPSDEDEALLIALEQTESWLAKRSVASARLIATSPSAARLEVILTTPTSFSPPSAVPVEHAKSVVAAAASPVSLHWTSAENGASVACELPLDPPVLRRVEASLARCLGCADKVERIPHSTEAGLRKSVATLLDLDDVERWLRQCLPDSILSSLAPHQLEGVRFGLRRNGRFLLADEMGTGKTLTALATALCCCHTRQAPLLVLAPKSLRLHWADEAEKWISWRRPGHVKVLEDSKRSGFLDELIAMREGRKDFVVVSSLRMALQKLKCMLDMHWGTVIVDESHKLHTPKSSDRKEARAIFRIVGQTPHAILSSGTPSLRRPFDIYNLVESLRPGMLGASKQQFKQNYCCESQLYRLEELHMLLKETVMVRRQHSELAFPCGDRSNRRCRRMIEVQMKPGRCAGHNSCHFSGDEDERAEGPYRKRRSKLHSAGLAKVDMVVSWLLCRLVEPSGDSDRERSVRTQKIVIFAHHIDVMDELQRQLSQVVRHSRLDGSSDVTGRQEAVRSFQCSDEIEAILVSITAGAEGIDLSAADCAVFAELPPDIASLMQAECRVDRGQRATAPTFYYIACRHTYDVKHWIRLNESFSRVNLVHDGMSNSYEGLEAESVEHVQTDLLMRSVEALPSSTPLDKQSSARDCLALSCCSTVNSSDAGAGRESPLCFEASPCTRRFHALRKESTRYLPAETNFLPEDVFKDGAPAHELSNIGALEIARQLIVEWMSLSAKERATLYQQPIVPPLRQYLAALKEDGQRAGSTRRYLASEQLLASPPKDGKVADAFIPHRGRYLRKQAIYSANGKRLCNVCGSDLPRNRGYNTPESIRDLFCSDKCALRYTHTVKPGGLREDLFGVERGVCCRCERDCHAFVRALQVHKKRARHDMILRFDPRYRRYPRLLHQLAYTAHEGSAWHADHIVPVFEGGGECGLENMQTLCTMCHQSSSRSLARKRKKRTQIMHERTSSACNERCDDRVLDEGDFKSNRKLCSRG
jgi:hypothetical protein